MGFINTMFYVDDGYSGTNFDRPAFKQMIRDIENGLVGVIMTKDLSRLGRNYIESGTYIELFFPEHNVRYIAVNDGIDSDNANEMDITPFKNILNEMYSRDISKKVKSGKRIRAEQGKFMGNTAPFGLKKDPADKNHLIIDEETAPTVKLIFDLALKGYGTNRIGKVLYADKVRKPAFYKPEYFRKYITKPDEAYDWKEETITRILRNPIYKGHMWVCNYSKTHLKSKRRGYIPISERKIIPADHEAIIPETEWDAVQDVLDRHTKIKPCSSGYNNVFRRLLKCPDCGGSLLLHTDNRNKLKSAREKTFFQCRTYRIKGTGACSQHRINATDLEDAVLSDIQSLAENVVTDREEFVENVLHGLGDVNREVVRELSARVDKLRAENGEADERYVKLYDALTNGIISESKFKLMSRKVEEKQERNAEEIKKLEAQLGGSTTDLQDVEIFAKELAGAVKIRELSSELLNRLIERIEVSDSRTEDGEKIQNVRIFYKFVGVLG